MPSRSVVVIGGDRGAQVVAARLALEGHAVVLWQPPSPGEPLSVPGAKPCIKLGGAGGDRDATLDAATADPFEAFAVADVVLASAPPEGLGAIADVMLPLIEPRHTLVVLGGGLHALVAAKWLRDRGRGDLPTLAGSDTTPVAVLDVDGDRLRVLAVVERLGFGVFPAVRTEATMAVLADLFPGAKAHAHVLAAALAAVEPMVRDAALLMNLGAVEPSRAGFSVFDQCFTESVARVTEVLDAERLALSAALGLDLPTAAEALSAWGLSPRGDLWAAVNGSFALTRGVGDVSPSAGPAAHTAWGMCVWAELADQLAVPAPLTRSLWAVSAAAGAGHGAAGWSLGDVGLDGMSAETMLRMLAGGSDAVAG